MNEIAISTVIIIILILPGAIFRKAYYSSYFSSKYFSTSNFEFLVFVVSLTLIIHTIGLSIYCVFFNLDVNFLQSFLFVPENDSLQILINNLGWIILYNVSLNVFGFVAGVFTRTMVRRQKWDVLYNFPRFNNLWHYVFSGEILALRTKNLSLVPNVDILYVNILVETINENLLLYSGFVEQYDLKNDNLESLHLKAVRRRKLSKKDYEKIPGNIMVFKGSNILNLNVFYVDLLDDLNSNVPDSVQLSIKNF